MFLLGAAYGVIEEGLMVRSFFDPGWMDLGVLGVYGRWLEVNWVWSEWLIIHHAIFSIAIPITLVELAYPDRMNDRSLSKRKLAGVTVLLCAVTMFGYGFLTTYRPPAIQYTLSVGLVVVLFLLAWKVPQKTGKNGSLKSWKPIKLMFMGLTIATTFFFLFMAGPYMINQPLFLMTLGLILILAVFNFIRRFSWNESTLFNKFALAAGAIGFLIALTPLQGARYNQN